MLERFADFENVIVVRGILQNRARRSTILHDASSRFAFCVFARSSLPKLSVGGQFAPDALRENVVLKNKKSFVFSGFEN